MEGPSEIQIPHFESSTKVSLKDGWITPGGIFYGCTPEEHDECAQYLLQTNQEDIKESLELNHSEILEDIDGLNPRRVLHAAGYALLSSGLIVESNMPESLTTEQLELMEKNGLTFAPESGRLQPS